MTRTDEPTPCPECGIGDAEYGVHERGCPSGYPTLDDTDPVAVPPIPATDVRALLGMEEA